MTALLYGVALGAGVATRIAATTFYVAALWTVLNGSAAHGALVMVTFGLGRALPPLWLVARGSSVEEAFHLTDRAMAWQPVMHLANGLALGFAGSYLLVAGLMSP